MTRRVLARAAAGAVAVGLLASTGQPGNAATSLQNRSGSAGSDQAADIARSTAKPRPQFPGHRPGRIYLGMSCDDCDKRDAQLGRNIGLIRTYVQWGVWDGVAKDIREARHDHRLPWISIEGPDNGSSTGWRSVGDGEHNREIRGLARVLKAHDDRPLFLSFDHEMSNNAPESEGIWWAHGFNQFHDVLQNAHALRRVALAPIFVSWLFDPANTGQDPANWLPPSTLRRASFMGVDLYQSDSGKAFGRRLPAVHQWLARHGHRRMLIGLGEVGATDVFGNVGAAAWLNKSLHWSARHANRVAAISYFNSTANSDPNVYWPLDESQRKLDVYRKWLGKPVFVNHLR
jgi:hypothetical protein